MTGDHHLAEDLLQSAFATVAARWERLRDGEPEAYVRQIIYRNGISWWRKHPRETVRLVDDDRRTADVA